MVKQRLKTGLRLGRWRSEGREFSTYAAVAEQKKLPTCQTVITQRNSCLSLKKKPLNMR